MHGCSFSSQGVAWKMMDALHCNGVCNWMVGLPVVDSLALTCVGGWQCDLIALSRTECGLLLPAVLCSFVVTLVNIQGVTYWRQILLIQVLLDVCCWQGVTESCHFFPDIFQQQMQLMCKLRLANRRDQ